MIEIIFSYLSTLTAIKCKKEEKFKDILEKFKSKVNINLSEHIYLYNGTKITNFVLTSNEIANSLDKKNSKMTVLVMPIGNESQKNFQNKINFNINLLNKKTKRNPSDSSTIEELYSIIFDLKEEIKVLKQSNYYEIQNLKQEIKSIKNELEIYKANFYNNKKDLELNRKNNIINEQNIQNLIIGNLHNAISSNMIFAKGMILAWYGFINDVPNKWAICNGQNGTPDLRNKFIMGVGDISNFGKIGGKSSIKLKKDNLPPIGAGSFSSDSHGGAFHHKSNGIVKYKSKYSVSVKGGAPDGWGSNYLIDLNEGMKSTPVDIMNPYYALFYIMKL